MVLLAPGMPRACPVEPPVRFYSASSPTTTAGMPRARPVEPPVRFYFATSHLGCHGLAPWSLPFVSILPRRTWNAPACPVEPPVRFYSASRQPPHLGCHGLAPWSLPFVSILPRRTWDATGLPRGASRSFLFSLLANHHTCWDATGLARGASRSFLFCHVAPGMPRACPVEPPVRFYSASRQPHLGCHGLAPWSLPFVSILPRRTWDATGLPRGASRSFLFSLSPTTPGMPRACPVEPPVRFYFATSHLGCHGLAPWSLPFVSIQPLANHTWDATGLPRGASRSFLFYHVALAYPSLAPRLSAQEKMLKDSRLLRIRWINRALMPRPGAAPLTCLASRKSCRMFKMGRKGKSIVKGQQDGFAFLTNRGILALSLAGAPLSFGQPTLGPRIDRYGDALPEGAIARLGTLQLTHLGGIESLAISPDGTVAASGVRDGKETYLGERKVHEAKGITLEEGVRITEATIRLWDVKAGELLRQILTPDALSRTSILRPTARHFSRDAASSSAAGKAIPARRFGSRRLSSEDGFTSKRSCRPAIHSCRSTAAGSIVPSKRTVESPIITINNTWFAFGTPRPAPRCHWPKR